jgi:alkylhydroperoxidase/carboxymuconolactone decarboxylase family protein YurZ
VVAPARCSSHSRRVRLQNKCEMKMDPQVRELVTLSALAALGCGLAAVQGDFVFIILFAAASIVTIIEMIRRLR